MGQNEVSKFSVCSTLKDLRILYQKKSKVQGRINYVVQFILADKNGKVLIPDDGSCYIFSKRDGKFISFYLTVTHTIKKVHKAI